MGILEFLHPTAMAQVDVDIVSNLHFLQIYFITHERVIIKETYNLMGQDGYLGMVVLLILSSQLAQHQ